MIGNIGQGEQIEAKVDEQNHAVSIRSAQAVRVIAVMPNSRDRWRQLFPVSSCFARRRPIS